MLARLAVALFLLIAVPMLSSYPYPIDGYEETGIRRLERLRPLLLRNEAGLRLLPGQLKPTSEIRLHLEDNLELDLTNLPVDSRLQVELEGLFRERHRSYSLALLDVTPSTPLRLVKIGADIGYQPGSVGKLAVALGLFAELEKLFPGSTSRRRQLLRDRIVTAGHWIETDHHNVPLFDPETETFSSRPIRKGDRFSLYEWLDHMLSPSSNAAASTVWKEAILMRALGDAYPPSREHEDAFFNETPKMQLTRIGMSVVNDPLRILGIDERAWRLGSFFTRAGNRIVPGSGGSRATPMGLLTFLVRLEQGRVIDPWSSLELKKLLYLTARRIRYASSPELNDSAVYFKSGSLYSCEEEPGFECGQYRGNRANYMNSVAIVETPDRHVYMVAMMSNVLRVNSAVEHQSLATFIDRMVRR